MPILHHYPASLFSEKIRTLLGYLEFEWQSVVIPAIMPRPHLMPLSGGYRKTPILQIGANVYCDTDIIARTLAHLAGDETVYAHGFAADRVARWADTELFRTTVALNFRPEAVASQMNQLSAEEIGAFMKDRAQLSGDRAPVQVDPAAAEAHFIECLQSLEESLDQDFLFGPQPSIADFSVYHCLWFIAGNALNGKLISEFPGVGRFLGRMAAFGHGTLSELGAEAALAEGKATEPVSPSAAGVDPRISNGLTVGADVSVSADDYGRNPISGKLVHWTTHEVVIAREDPEAGSIMVHFPNMGFEVAPVSD